MLDEKKIGDLKKLLEESVNPLFLFDNDPDGFCSVLILLKNFEKGHCLPIKSFPNIDTNLFDRIDDLSPDKIFILDKPFTDIEFLKTMKERGIQVIVIDHHSIDINPELESLAKFFSSFPSSEPTSFICQKIMNNKNTEWISLIGCIYDVFMPDFIERFQENYPEMIDPNMDIAKVRYSSEIGKITILLSLALKSSNQTVQNMIELFLKMSGPKEILIENEENKYIHRKFNQLNRLIEKNIKKIKEYPKLVFLEYSGEYSLSSDISNLLFFKHPKKFIVVCYKKYDSVNISIRGEGARSFTENVVKSLENSTGGGHDVACGLRIPYELFGEFKKMVFDKFGLEKA